MMLVSAGVCLSKELMEYIKAADGVAPEAFVDIETIHSNTEEFMAKQVKWVMEARDSLAMIVHPKMAKL